MQTNNLDEIDRLLHETMPEPQGTAWRYATILRLMQEIREQRERIAMLIDVLEDQRAMPDPNPLFPEEKNV